MGINQQRISQITNNTSFGNIGNLLSQGQDMEYIAAHYQMDNHPEIEYHLICYALSVIRDSAYKAINALIIA